MSGQDMVADSRRKATRSRKGGTKRKKDTRVNKIPKVFFSLLLLSFFVFTLGVVGYVIFFGGVHA
jgi:hypothetical protein